MTTRSTTSTPESVDDGTRAYPLMQAFARLSIGRVTGYGLISAGQLRSFTIGRRRYIAARELQRFIRTRIEETARETPEQRAARVAPAVKGRARRRREDEAVA